MLLPGLGGHLLLPVPGDFTADVRVIEHHRLLVCPPGGNGLAA
jgi:hypothetical protein